jgi:formylglycine-generating enzyme required for sulfatase activity
LHQVESRSEIDLSYISCAEYQLFLDDARAQGRFLHPDHWTAYQFSSGQARAPVVGVRSGDVRAFADWLTERQGDGWIYRVPTPTKAMEYPAVESHQQVAAWCRMGDEWRLVGLSEEGKHALLERMRTLSKVPLPSFVNDNLDR